MDDFKAASDFPRPKIKSTKGKTREKGRGEKRKKEKKKRENIRVKRSKIASVEPSLLAAEKQLQGNSINSADTSTPQGDSTGTNNNKRDKGDTTHRGSSSTTTTTIIKNNNNIINDDDDDDDNINTPHNNIKKGKQSQKLNSKITQYLLKEDGGIFKGEHNIHCGDYYKEDDPRNNSIYGCNATKKDDNSRLVDCTYCNNAVCFDCLNTGRHGVKIKANRKKVMGPFACPVCIEIAMKASRVRSEDIFVNSTTTLQTTPKNAAVRTSTTTQKEKSQRIRRPDGSYTSIFGAKEDEEALDSLDLRLYRRADLPSFAISEAGLAAYDETLARIFDGIEVKLDVDTGESVVTGSDEEIARAIKMVTILHLVCCTAINSKRDIQKTIRKRIKMLNKGWWRYLLDITSLVGLKIRERKIRKAGKNSADVMIPKKKKNECLNTGHPGKAMKLITSEGLANKVPVEMKKKLYPEATSTLPDYFWSGHIESFYLPPKTWVYLMKKLDTSSGGDLWSTHNKTLRAVARSTIPASDENNSNKETTKSPKYTSGTLAICTLLNLMGAGKVPQDLMYIFRDVKSFYIIKKKDSEGNLKGVRPIGARSIFSRIFGKGVACSLLKAMRKLLGMDNSILDHVGIEKLIKACVAILECHPQFIGLFPDIINAFNSMDRAKMLRIFSKDPQLATAMNYLKIAYMEYPELIESFDETTMKSESGATQGCPLAMMLFAYAFSKVFKKVRKIIDAMEENTDPKDKTFLGAIADDASIIGTPYKAVVAYLNMQKIAEQDFNLKFHTLKCNAFSMKHSKTQLTKLLQEAQTKALANDPTLNKYRIVFKTDTNSEGIGIHDDGIRLLGAPIGSAEFKLQYMRETFRQAKDDWAKVQTHVSDPKKRLDLLKYCLNPRFNHLFRCVEPEVTTLIADELDNWFFKQVCTVICPHWDENDRALFHHFMSPLAYGGSGMTKFRDKIDAAYAASYLDCLFDKGIAFNGALPIGSKPITSMHAIFAPLALKRKELPKTALSPQGNCMNRMETWFSNFKLMDFNTMDLRIKSFESFKNSCRRLFQVPEVRRACFESQVAYNAINGAYCYIHPKLGIPLPSRRQLFDKNLWINAQHNGCKDTPTFKRDDGLPFTNKAHKKTTAYSKIPVNHHHLSHKDAEDFYKDYLSSGESLAWLLGRKDADESKGSMPFWNQDEVLRHSEEEEITDISEMLCIAEEGDNTRVTLAPRQRIQSRMQRLIHDSIANIQLDDRYLDLGTFESPKDCISGKPIDILQKYTPLSQERRTLMYTSLTGAKSGWALFHLSNRPNWEIRNPRDFRHAMDMKFSRFLHEFKQLRVHCKERSKLGFCPGATHPGAAHPNAHQNARGGRCLNNCTKGSKYALHGAAQAALAKAINGDNLKAVIIEAQPYALTGVRNDISKNVRTDISVSTAENPGEVLYYIDTTVGCGLQ